MNAPEKASSFGLSLASRLCSIVNDSPATSVETVLAEYLLQHYNMLDTLNIYQFAEACRVPRSSIHRFCGKIGYANFSELKLSCRRETDSYRYFTELSGRHDFRDQLGHEIIHMVSDMNRRTSEDLLGKLADQIDEARSVFLLASYSAISALKDFQRPMVLCGKLVNVVASPHAHDKLRKASEEDLILVVSAMGKFAETYNDFIQPLPGKKILVTASHHKEIQTPYDQVIIISSIDGHHIKTAYAKYGISYFFDNLYSLYYRKYGILQNQARQTAA